MLLKLEDQKQRAQTKITHNSASLNMSEQQYWINATEDKIKYHNTNIDRLEKNINSITLSNAEILIKINSSSSCPCRCLKASFVPMNLQFFVIFPI